MRAYEHILLLLFDGTVIELVTLPFLSFKIDIQHRWYLSSLLFFIIDGASRQYENVRVIGIVFKCIMFELLSSMIDDSR
jgi:hypothetical protein